jgi:uncharacterized protein (UPF0303 family)
VTVPDQQPPDLPTLLAQEERLQFDAFDHDTAWALGTALVETARAADLPVTIDVRYGEQQVFRAALPGSELEQADWIRRKSRVVDELGHSSFYVGRGYAERDVDPETELDPATYAAHGGAFPIIVRGKGRVGVVTVSGLPQQQDHELVVRVLEELLAKA